MEAASGFGLTWRVGDDTLKMFQKYNVDLEESSGESHHLLPVPAVYILDKSGRVLFSYVNPDYKIRIDPATLLAAATAAAG